MGRMRVCHRVCRRWDSVLVVAGFLLFTMYLVVMKAVTSPKTINIRDLEKQIDQGNPVRKISYDEVKESYHEWEHNIPKDTSQNPLYERTLRYHNIWQWTDKAINRYELFPESDDIDVVLKAMKTAKIVHVDVLDIGDYESGTSEKWVVHLEGGIKAMAKLMWEGRQKMKPHGLCNYGYEMPTSEIAAFHLHRLLGFRNTPYVVGRKIDLLQEILPAASTIVSKQIRVKGNKACVTGKCYFCANSTTWCPENNIVEASLSYWVPRALRLYTKPPKYMPWSTPNRHSWKKYGFNDKTYCEHVKKTFHPYEYQWYYLDLFDFAILDTLMYHFDTKHYIIYDDSEAQGLTVRLDHGRTFCALDRDDYEIFLMPLMQCCKLRQSTWLKLKNVKGDKLTKKLKKYLSKDPLAPVLDESWYKVLDRRVKHIISVVERCAKENGGLDEVLVDSETSG